MLDNLPNEILGFIIGAVAGLARYFSVVIQEETAVKFGVMLMRIFVAGVIGVFAIYIAPLLTDNSDLQRVLSFIGGVAAHPIMNIIEKQAPSLISKKLGGPDVE